jgi:elongation factor Ts
MAFTAKDVQELRRRTGAGMMDCKKALEDTGGDIDKAIELLRTKGIARAEKRAGRAASEGQIVSATDATRGVSVIAEVNSETDFVARNVDFGKLVAEVARQVLADDSLDGVVVDTAAVDFMSRAWQGGTGNQTVEQVIQEASARTGENIVVRRFARFQSDGEVGIYIHHNGKVAAMVDMRGGRGVEVEAVARSIAEHIAAGVPSVALGVSKEDVPSAVLDRERRIFEEQARASGKPDNIVQKMIDGRVDKYYKEVTLLEQPWVRDDSRTIRQLLEDASRKTGSQLVVKRFARFQMGE